MTSAWQLYVSQQPAEVIPPVAFVRDDQPDRLTVNQAGGIRSHVICARFASLRGPDTHILDALAEAPVDQPLRLYPRRLPGRPSLPGARPAGARWRLLSDLGGYGRGPRNPGTAFVAAIGSRSAPLPTKPAVSLAVEKSP